MTLNTCSYEIREITPIAFFINTSYEGHIIDLGYRTF